MFAANLIQPVRKGRQGEDGDDDAVNKIGKRKEERSIVQHVRDRKELQKLLPFLT